MTAPTTASLEERWNGCFKLIEEMGELQQVLGKLGSKPCCDHWSGDLLEMLHDEVADVMAAIGYFSTKNGLDAERLDERMREKIAMFNNWKLPGLKIVEMKDGE